MKNISDNQGFPGGSDGKESTCNVGDWVINVLYFSEDMTSLTSPDDKTAKWDFVHCLCWNHKPFTLKRHKSVDTEGKRADCAGHLSIVPAGPLSIVLHTVLCLTNMTCRGCINRPLVSSGSGHWRDPERQHREEGKSVYLFSRLLPCSWVVPVPGPKTTDRLKTDDFTWYFPFWLY